jgi:hypothetical protein
LLRKIRFNLNHASFFSRDMLAMALSKSVARVLLFAFLFIITDAQDHGQCQKTDQCVCLFDDGWSVNLNPIGEFKFSTVSGDYRYTYWPCQNNNGDAPVCTTPGAVIQVNVDNSYCASCGDATSTDFGYDGDGSLYIEYSNGEEGRKSKVKLVCSENTNPDPSNFVFDSEGENLDYTFTLTSKSACPLSPGDNPTPINPSKNPPVSSSSSTSISPGTILCIIAVVLVVVNLVVGVVFMKFYKKDGFIFFLSLFPCGKNLSVTNNENL